MAESFLTRVRSLTEHVSQKLKNRYRRVFGTLSNISLFVGWYKAKLFAREFPRMSRLLTIAAALEREVTWSDIIPFLNSKSEMDEEFVAYLISGSSGFFVEFGAMDGFTASNTFILETYFGWRGLLAEANPDLQAQCLRKRNNPCFNGAIIGERNSNLSDSPPYTARFLQVNDQTRLGLSTLEKYLDSDMHSKTRREGFKIIEVETLTLEEFLDNHDAPRKIDFLSIDTEGSEIEIIANFPFTKFDIQFICVEHNHGVNKGTIMEIVLGAGFNLIDTSLSGGDFWFVKELK